MGYPQPDPDQYTLGGQTFWRLNTLLVSDGDMYQSKQGSGGFAIGPDSDIAKVNIAYFDDQVPGLMNQIAISPQRPFGGTMFARNSSQYLPSQRPGRFLIWPDEIYNPDWRPGDFDPGNYRLDFITPVLDVVEYFAPIGLNASRNDKEYLFQELPDNANAAGGGAIWGLLIPFYGRRYASIFTENFDTHMTVQQHIYGLTYCESSSVLTGDSGLVEVQAFTPMAAAAIKVIKASISGMFDALFLKFTYGSDNGETGTSDVVIRVRVSDQEV